MAKPILLAVHDQPADLKVIRQELTSRYAADYEIVCEESPASALAPAGRGARHARCGGAGPVRGQRDDRDDRHRVPAPGSQLHPHAQRVLLIPFSNRSASKPILRLISLGRIDRYATMPTRSPDENFHHLVTELLRDWQQQQLRSPDGGDRGGRAVGAALARDP